MKTRLSLLVIIFLIGWSSCTNRPNYPLAMQEAESYMNSYPDSALYLLESLADSISSFPEETQMYYHLLCIQAKDKQYIEHTDDSLINCIVEFYEDYDNADKQTMAYYYKGSVYRDMNDAPRALKVYEVETTGRETVSQEAWLIGTVQKVVLPYTFQVRFSLDLSQAQVRVDQEDIVVSIPRPKAGYQKLIVDQDHIEKVDWLYPLTTERYADILNEVEQKLFRNAAENPEFQSNAWNLAVENLQNLFSAVADQSLFGKTCQIRILPLEEFI